MTDPSSPPPIPATTPAIPWSDTELRALLRRPARAFDVVLARRDRLTASIAAAGALWPLVAALVACTLLAAIPYGLVRGLDAWWKVGALFGGSVALCLPALQVFGAYLGSGLSSRQATALAFVISSVAALFTLGFFPILWFLGATMRDGDWIDADVASVVMLGAALAAGLGQLLRCVALDRSLLANRSLGLLLIWQLLVAFVCLRMARALDLLGGSS